MHRGWTRQAVSQVAKYVLKFTTNLNSQMALDWDCSDFTTIYFNFQEDHRTFSSVPRFTRISPGLLPLQQNTHCARAHINNAPVGYYVIWLIYLLFMLQRLTNRTAERQNKNQQNIADCTGSQTASNTGRTKPLSRLLLWRITPCLKKCRPFNLLQLEEIWTNNGTRYLDNPGFWKHNFASNVRLTYFTMRAQFLRKKSSKQNQLFLRCWRFDFYQRKVSNGDRNVNNVKIICCVLMNFYYETFTNQMNMYIEI